MRAWHPHDIDSDKHREQQDNMSEASPSTSVQGPTSAGSEPIPAPDTPPGAVVAPLQVADSVAADTEPASLAEASPSPMRLPYAFARNQGVLLLPSGNQTPQLLYRDGSLSPLLLSEIRRHIRGPLGNPQALNSEEFQKRLTECYQTDDSEASRAAADLDRDGDLAQLADEIPESTDLMEDGNDAPVVRLINAVLSQAVREEVSDIHIETFEENVSVRFRCDGVLRESAGPEETAGTAADLQTQSHGQAGYRREAHSSGRAHLGAHWRSYGGYPAVDDTLRSRRAHRHAPARHR